MTTRIRRNKHEIVSQILAVASKGAKKIELAKKVKLNYAQLNKYIRYLSNRGLIELKIDRARGVITVTTEKGNQLMHIYENIYDKLKLLEKRLEI